MKKAISIFMAALMVCTFAVTAFAYKNVTITCGEPTIGENQIKINDMTVTDSEEGAIKATVAWYAVPADEEVNLATYDFSKLSMMTGTYKEGYQYVLNIYFAGSTAKSITVNGNAMTKNKDNTYYYNFGEAKQAESEDTGFIAGLVNFFKMLGQVFTNMISVFSSLISSFSSTSA